MNDSLNLRQSVPVVAIDGPSGSGKGAVTMHIAAWSGFHVLDSGALYRLVGLAARKAGVALDDERRLERIATQLEIEFKADETQEDWAVYLDRELVTQLI